MFNERYIQDRIDIIFDVEKDNLQKNYKFHYLEKFNPPKFGPETLSRRLKSDFDLTSNDDFYLEWKAYRTLKQLYNKIEINPDAREIFIIFIKEKLLNCDEFCMIIDGSIKYFNASSLAFYFLMKIGENYSNIKIIKLKNRKKNRAQLSFPVMQGLFEDILLFMHIEPSFFENDILNNLKEINSLNIYFAKSSIKFNFENKVNIILYERLQNELLGVNEELNLHKEQVIGIISKFGFPREMEQFLLEIDEISELSDWASINSGMIGNLRSFFEELIKNMALTIESNTGKICPDRKIGTLRTFINDYLNITKHEDEFIDSFITMLHVEGGHAFLSERKYFLLLKNIGIEIAYFLLGKLEDFIEN